MDSRFGCKHIKVRGTTFIFSNNYMLDTQTSGSYLVQNLENTGNFLIKSVVLEDTAVLIQKVAASTDSGNVTTDMRAFFGNPASGSAWNAPGEIYLTAQIDFNGEGALDSLGSDSQPTFSWAIKKGNDFDEDFESTSETTSKSSPYDNFGTVLSFSKDNSSKEWIENFWFVDYATFSNNGIGYNHRFIPEGKLDNNDSEKRGPSQARLNKTLERFNYLTLGRLIKKGGVDRKYIAESGVWSVGTGTGDEGYQLWMQDYAFTAAGLPAYRQDLTGTAQTLRPSILPYFDHSAATNTVIDNTKGGSVVVTPYQFDLSKLTVGNRQFSGLGESHNYKTVLWNEPDGPIQSYYSLTDFTNNEAYTSGNYHMAIDLFYLLLAEGRERTEESSTSSSTTLVDTNNWEQKLFDKTGTKLKYRIGHYSKLWSAATTDEIYGLNIIKDLTAYNYYCSIDLPLSRDNTQKNPTYSDFGSIQIGSKTGTNPKNCLPLDISPVNIDRFKQLLENTDFLNKVIDGLRQFSPEALQVEANSTIPADTFVPLMLAVRAFENNDNPYDGFSTLAGRVHPRNVLDFFSLDAAGIKAYPLNLPANNIYTVLPIIQ